MAFLIELGIAMLPAPIPSFPFSNWDDYENGGIDNREGSKLSDPEDVDDVLSVNKDLYKKNKFYSIV